MFPTTPWAYLHCTMRFTKKKKKTMRRFVSHFSILCGWSQREISWFFVCVCVVPSETRRPKRWMVQMIMNYGLIKSTLKLSLSKVFMLTERRMPWPYRSAQTPHDILAMSASSQASTRDAFTIFHIHWMLCLYGVTYATRHTCVCVRINKWNME